MSKTLTFSTLSLSFAAAAVAAGLSSTAMLPTLPGVGWLVTVCAALSAVFCFQSFRATQRHHKQARCFLAALAPMEATELADRSFAGERLPRLDDNNPLERALLKLQHRMHDLGEACCNSESTRTRAEVRMQKVRGEQDRVRHVFDALNDPVLMINEFNDVVLTNPAAELLLGLAPADGQRRMLDAVECRPLVELMSEMRRRPLPCQRSADISIVDRDGESRQHRVICRGVAAQDDTLSAHAVVAVLTDVSDRQQLQRRHAEFVSAVSHEMKTPLTSIKAYAELLEDDDLPGEMQDEFLDVIQGQTDRLQRLIDNLLDLARIEAGVVDVDKRARSMNEVLQEAFEIVRPAAEQKRIRLESDLSPMHLSVLADRDLLLQSAINLLSNAIKYTPDEGSVTLRSRLEDGLHVYEVADTGVGLSEEDQQRIFDRFYRVKRDKSMASGTGLGLPLAKHIVEDVHGGELTLTSEVGVGSTFRAALPAARQLETAH
ncbi:MAG: ATP-binding protein [Pirellulaceae bacterium]|nr:ATP-binding protein [Pirellulaceae bacterium]